jgi:tyrosyl-DNA phosphodiesterase-1
VQDFPLKEGNDESKITSPNNKLADTFVEAIVRMLRSMNSEAGIKTLLDEGIIQLHSKSSALSGILARYDFSKVKVALVSSIPGKYKGAEMQTVGHTGLMRALRNIGARCHPDKQISLECQVGAVILIWCFNQL